MVIVDPITNFLDGRHADEAEAMLMRLIDFLKAQQITGAVHQPDPRRQRAWSRREVGISSLIDTWLLLRDIELGGERNRGLYVLKSRGMAHSNQIREFLLTADGVELRDVYVGPEGVLTGSMRLAQEAREQAAELAARASSSGAGGRSSASAGSWKRGSPRCRPSWKTTRARCRPRPAKRRRASSRAWRSARRCSTAARPAIGLRRPMRRRPRGGGSKTKQRQQARSTTS